MIGYSEIESISTKLGVSPENIEKDYHLDWYLAAFRKERALSSFIFYGGTAIKKLYLANHRFSEDLDFISAGRMRADVICSALERIHHALERNANLFYSYRPEEIQQSGTQTRWLIHYRGFSQLGGLKRFLLDFAQGIENLPAAVNRKLLTHYRDLENVRVRIRALPLECICANKLALVVDRRRVEPRDMYDLWFVLMHVRKFDRVLFCSYLRKILTHSPDISVIRSFFRNLGFQNAWEIRLKYQVPHLPDFNVVLIELTEKLEKLLHKPR